MPMDRSRNPGESSSPADRLCRVSYLYAKRPVVQLNGKVRHRFRAEAGLGGDALLAAAKDEPR